MTVEEIRALVTRFVDEPWNKGNVNFIDEACAQDYFLHYLPETKLEGREALKQAVLQTRASLQDFKATVGEIIIEDDQVAYEWAMSGLENGQPKKMVGITMLRIQDGKIVSDRFVAQEVNVKQPVG